MRNIESSSSPPVATSDDDEVSAGRLAWQETALAVITSAVKEVKTRALPYHTTSAQHVSPWLSLDVVDGAQHNV